MRWLVLIVAFSFVACTEQPAGRGAEDAEVAHDGGLDAEVPDARGEPDASAHADAEPAVDLGVATLDAAAPDVTPEDARPAEDAFVIVPESQDAHFFDAEVPDATEPLDAGVTCTSCHGTPGGSSAPPRDLAGHVDTSAPGVGAHQVHLRRGALFRVGRCEDCHVVPLDVSAPGHLDPAPADLAWGTLATQGITASYVAGQCTVYCHGATLPGGAVPAPEWTRVDGTQAYCGACHGVPPPPPHPAAPGGCGGCHPFTNGTPNDPERHPNGVVDFTGGACGGCHGVPPDTGAHRAHYGDRSSPPLVDYGDLRTQRELFGGQEPGYVFGCGHCHPRDPARHVDGRIEVELYDPTAPADSLKALNDPSAAYAAETCAGVYCHSSGQASPTFVTTPSWRTGTLSPEAKCGACHGNPPRYPSGGAGTPTANTHLVLADDGVEFGHFGGMPGAWHTSYHGAQGAAPITCQTCHFETVDPANTAPGGFYYLDTSGDYDLGGGLGLRCPDCHDGTSSAPPAGTGRVTFGRHLDGRRDVAFDPRTTLPSSLAGLPTGADRPTHPYWVRAQPDSAPPGSSQTGRTWSLTLEGASYDPIQKTCANVPCHLAQSFGTGRPELEPLRWGVAPVGYATCEACHQY